MLPLLIKAGKVAIASNINDDKKNFLLGCIGIRAQDGVMVSAKNGAVITSSYNSYKIIGDAHAEMRVLKKMGRGGILYTTRILKNGTFAMARACAGCRQRIKMAEVDRVYYTIDQNHYGVWLVKYDIDKIYDC